jgi:diguanylate cyclase (GGDEF)-like protein/PAS domain S-box-containing protein
MFNSENSKKQKNNIAELKSLTAALQQKLDAKMKAKQQEAPKIQVQEIQVQEEESVLETELPQLELDASETMIDLPFPISEKFNQFAQDVSPEIDEQKNLIDFPPSSPRSFPSSDFQTNLDATETMMELPFPTSEEVSQFNEDRLPVSSPRSSQSSDFQTQLDAKETILDFTLPSTEELSQLDQTFQPELDAKVTMTEHISASTEYASKIDQTFYQQIDEQLSQEKLDNVKQLIKDFQTENKFLKEQFQALRESEQRFRQIAESVREVFFLMDSNSDKMLYISPAYEKVWGRTRQSVYEDPQSWLMAIHPEDSFRAMATLETQFRTGDEFEEEYRIIRPDQSIRWVWVRAFPVRDHVGRVCRFVGMVEDITERKEAEELIRKSEEQFRLTFEKAPIGMAITDLEGRFVKVNESLCDALGYTEDELLELSFAHITHADDLPIHEAREQELLKGDLSDFQMETRYKAKDERIVDTILKVVIVRDSEHHPLHFNNQIVDITERKQMEKQLLQDAFYDTLTKLPNRALFMDRLGQAIKRRKREPNYLFAVLFLDIDRFKVVNDSMGHLLGDKLLIAIARRLETCVRPMDTVARLGGDEFTILLEDITHVEDATDIAERIYASFQTSFKIDDHEIFTTASIGIALSSDHYQQADELLRDADISMYQAKEQGKAQYQVFDHSMYTQALKRLQLENDLRRGIEKDEFELFYQPIIHLSTGCLAGFEALVRWNHPEHQMISPAEFIPIAEETGLIVPLGTWILREACRQLRQWKNKFSEDYTFMMMSINLSGKQFSDPHLIQNIDQFLAEYDLPGNLIKLEITESLLMDNTEAATYTLKQIRERNIQLSIDDFGTGYSSLSYLHRFPVNTVKIDRSFVNRINPNANSDNVEIVKAIISLAHILKMDVVAEGIETNEQLVHLRFLDCEYGQGYFFAKPLNVKDAEGLMMRSPKW